MSGWVDMEDANRERRAEAMTEDRRGFDQDGGLPIYREYTAIALGYVSLMGTPVLAVYAAGMHMPELFFGTILGGVILGSAVSIYLRGI